jgi:hypothetical protein
VSPVWTERDNATFGYDGPTDLNFQLFGNPPTPGSLGTDAPEPASMVMLGIGLIAMLSLCRRFQVFSRGAPRKKAIPSSSL